MGILDGLFGGDDGGGDQTVTNKTQIPKWQEAFYRDYTSKIADQLDLARNVYNQQRSYQPYGGSRIQGFVPDEMKAYEKIRGDMGRSEPLLGAANSAIASARGPYGGPNYVGGDMGRVTADQYGGPRFAAGNVGPARAGTFTGSTVNSYMDPYKEQVLDQAIGRLGRERDRSILGDRAMATKSGALNSAGLALRNAETERGYADAVGNTAAQVLDQGYGRAADIYAGDQGRGLQATGINLQGIGQERQGFNQDQQSALQAAGINLQAIGQQQGMFNTGQARNLAAGQAFGALAGQGQQIRNADTNALLAAGQQQRQLGQQGLDLGYQDFQAQRDHPWQQLNNLSASTRGVQFAPSAGGSSTQTAGGNQGPSALTQLAGTGLAAYGLGKQFNWFSKGGRVRKPVRFGGGR